MAVSTNETISTLNNLIETCKDGEKGFREAAKDVKSEQLRTLFLQYAEQRQTFARELQNEVSRLGGTPETTGSTIAAIHRGWIDVKSAIAKRDDKAVIDECERGEDAAVANYRQAITEDLPTEFQSMVRRQYEAVQQAHDSVRRFQLQTV